MVSGTMTIDCPQCGKKAKFVETDHEVENFGTVIITTLSCEHCSFRFSDVLSVTKGKNAKKFKAEIQKPEDLKTKIIKSSTAKIKIPELGLEVSPGPRSDGYISNIEGLLERFQQAIEIISKTDKKKATQILGQIKKARAGQKKFTVLLEDPSGNSALVGDKNFKID